MLEDINVLIAKILDKLQFLWSKTNRWQIGLIIFLLVEFKIVPGRQVGFKCNDPALSYPFTGDTISWKALLATTVLLPLVVMLIVERIYNSDKIKNPKRQALCWYKEYLFGVLINLIIIETVKVFVGSPRPHFFDTCSPKEAVTCEGSEYVPNYTCTKAHWLTQSDRSFPSGHTSLALHAAFFLVYYLHKRTRHTYRSNAILFIQLVTVVSAVYCCISRVIDRRHHWWDVLAGASVVPPVLFYTIKHLCGDFECSSNVTKESSSDKDKPQMESNSSSIL